MKRTFLIVIAAILCINCAAFAADYSCSEWAKPYMEKACELGIIPESLEAADLTKEISREEFAELSVKLYEKLSGETAIADENIHFEDSDNPEVLKAASLGITNGVSDTKFDPTSDLTREQGATMLTRAYKKYALEGWTLEKDEEFKKEFRSSFRMPEFFSDSGSFMIWAHDSIYYMRARSIIDGVGNNKFDCKGNMTREQAIKIAVKMLAVTNNPYFAPMDALLVDTMNGLSLYSWTDENNATAALYDVDGNLINKYTVPVLRANADDDIWSLRKTDYINHNYDYGYYGGLAGLYEIRNKQLYQRSTRPVKDLLFVRNGAGSSGPIILTWTNLSDFRGYGADADAIINCDCDGKEEILLSAEDNHGIGIAGLESSDSIIIFYSENPVGMGRSDRYYYYLASASGGCPVIQQAEKGKNILVFDFEAGRPEVMDGFTYDDFDAYKKGYIVAEEKRLVECGVVWKQIEQ